MFFSFLKVYLIAHLICYTSIVLSLDWFETGFERRKVIHQNQELEREKQTQASTTTLRILLSDKKNNPRSLRSWHKESTTTTTKTEEVESFYFQNKVCHLSQISFFLWNIFIPTKRDYDSATNWRSFLLFLLLLLLRFVCEH